MRFLIWFLLSREDVFINVISGEIGVFQSKMVILEHKSPQKPKVLCQNKYYCAQHHKVHN